MSCQPTPPANIISSPSSERRSSFFSFSQTSRTFRCACPSHNRGRGVFGHAATSREPFPPPFLDQAAAATGIFVRFVGWQMQHGKPARGKASRQTRSSDDATARDDASISFGSQPGPTRSLSEKKPVNEFSERERSPGAMRIRTTPSNGSEAHRVPSAQPGRARQGTSVVPDSSTGRPTCR